VVAFVSEVEVEAVKVVGKYSSKKTLEIRDSNTRLNRVKLNELEYGPYPKDAKDEEDSSANVKGKAVVSEGDDGKAASEDFVGSNVVMSRFAEELADVVSEVTSPMSLVSMHAREATVIGAKYTPNAAGEDYELNRLARSLDNFPYGCSIKDVLSAHLEKDQKTKSRKRKGCHC
jgi:hypothetical protein